MRGIFSTSILIEDELGETKYDVRVLYRYDKGYAGWGYQPPEEASVEILEITPADKSLTVPEYFYEDESLLSECFADASVKADEESEWRAQSRRDQLMGGF